MNRRTFLKFSGGASLVGLWPRGLVVPSRIRRVRPSDAGWPSPAAWKRLNDSVDGNLIRVEFPINTALPADIKNPYYIGDSPGLT